MNNEQYFNVKNLLSLMESYTVNTTIKGLVQEAVNKAQCSVNDAQFNFLLGIFTGGVSSVYLAEEKDIFSEELTPDSLISVELIHAPSELMGKLNEFSVVQMDKYNFPEWKLNGGYELWMLYTGIYNYEHTNATAYPYYNPERDKAEYRISTEGPVNAFIQSGNISALTNFFKGKEYPDVMDYISEIAVQSPKKLIQALQAFSEANNEIKRKYWYNSEAGKNIQYGVTGEHLATLVISNCLKINKELKGNNLPISTSKQIFTKAETLLQQLTNTEAYGLALTMFMYTTWQSAITYKNFVKLLNEASQIPGWHYCIPDENKSTEISENKNNTRIANDIFPIITTIKKLYTTTNNENTMPEN